MTYLRPCWADKIPLTVFAVVALALLVLGSLGREGVPFAWEAYFSILWLLFSTYIALPWIILRCLDFACGGPSIRAANRRMREQMARQFDGVPPHASA